MGSPVDCWHTHTPLCPFFWLSSLSVAPSADSMSARGVLCDKHMMLQRLSFFEECDILHFKLHRVFCFVSGPFDSVFLYSEQIVERNGCKVCHSVIEGSCKAMPALVD
jgi:hypothetical protein